MQFLVDISQNLEAVGRVRWAKISLTWNWLGIEMSYEAIQSTKHVGSDYSLSQYKNVDSMFIINQSSRYVLCFVGL